MAVGYGNKTYKVGLMLASKAIRKYINKWRTQLENSLGEEGFLLLIAVLDAVDAMIGFLEDNP